MDTMPKSPPNTVQAAKSSQKTIRIRSRDVRSIPAARRINRRIDTQKVARIKAEMEAGTYRVDCHKTASRMIEESLINDLE